MAESSLYPRSEGYHVGYFVVADLPRPDGTSARVTLSRELSKASTLRRVLKRLQRRIPNARGHLSVAVP